MLLGLLGRGGLLLGLPLPVLETAGLGSSLGCNRGKILQTAMPLSGHSKGLPEGCLQ